MEEDKVTFSDILQLLEENNQSIEQSFREKMEQVVKTTFNETLKAFPPKQPSAFEDKPVTFRFDRDSKWFERYPLLHAKASQRHRCQPPEFTEEELEERNQLIEVLKFNKIYLDYCSEETVIDALSMLPRTDFHRLLFMLVRCGDETAFLELLSEDISFVSHPFFAHCLKGWTTEVREGDRAAKMTLKKVMEVMSQSVLKAAGVQGKGRPLSQVTTNRCRRFIELVTEDPDRQRKDSGIYGQMAVEEGGSNISHKDKINLKVNIKKTIQRHDLHILTRGLVPNKWGYTYLKEKY